MTPPATPPLRALRERDDGTTSLPKSLSLHIVHVVERHAPSGVEPVECVLATIEPNDTPQQIEQVVHFYRARWVIEEFFEALKTGCAYERLQLESAGAFPP